MDCILLIWDWVHWQALANTSLYNQFPNLTFRGPCIVIYSYNKNQRDALFLKFILIMDSTCFRQIYCLSSGVSTLYTQQYVLVMWTVCQQTVHITSMTNTYCCVYSVETPDDGQNYHPSSGVSTLYTQQYMLGMWTVCQQTVHITSMTNTYCCVYSVETPDDGQQICSKQVESFIKINLRNSASHWLSLSVSTKRNLSNS